MQGILLLFRLGVPFCYKNEKSHQKGAFSLAHNGVLLFLKVHLYFYAVCLFCRFIHAKFYIGICSNECPCYKLKWTSSNWMKIDEKISSNCKSIKIRKLLQKLFEPFVMYCISLTGYESKCFLTPLPDKIVSECT